jgi:hypothetical protein
MRRGEELNDEHKREECVNDEPQEGICVRTGRLVLKKRKK